MSNILWELFTAVAIASIVIGIGALMLRATHALDDAKRLDSNIPEWVLNVTLIIIILIACGVMVAGIHLIAG